MSAGHDAGAVPLVVPGRREDAAFAALRHREFRPYFATATLAMMADNVEHVISYWVIFAAFRSPALAGFAVISHWLPHLFFGIFIGALADRYDSRKLMHIAQLTFMGVSLAWAALFVTGALEMWHAAALLVFHGVASALFNPASQLVVHDMAGPRDLQSAIRLNAMGRNLAILFGPAVGGALLIALGPAMGLVANVLIYVPFSLWLLRTPYTGHLHRGPPLAGTSVLSIADALRTLREVSAKRSILAMVALVGVTSLLIGNAFQAQMPEFAAALAGGEDEIAYSALLVASALGSVLGGIVLESSSALRQARPNVAIALALAWSLAMWTFAATSTYVVALAALFVAGALNLAFSAMAQTIVQLEAPEARRGRVLGLFNMSQLGLRAGSGVSVGLLGAVIGIHPALGASAAVLVAACALLFATAGAPRRAR